MPQLPRRHFLQSIATAATAASLSGCQSLGWGSRKDRPNFVFILTDDQRFNALHCAGNPLIHTPTMDSIAERGVRFENAFVTTSICCPSRAACMTGRYGAHNGVPGLKNPALNDDEKTFAHYLKSIGYRTGMVGKWHLNNSPQLCGFDYHVFFRSNGPYYNRKVIDNGKETVAEEFIEDYNTARSIDFIRQSASRNRPFALFHCTQIPHMNHEFDWNARPETLALYDPQQMPVPESWQDELTGKPPYLKTERNRKQALSYGYGKQENIQRHFQRYYAAITEMDASLGNLLGELDRQGLRENTFIFLIGDNGWFMGEHGFTSKVLAYEESMRVPMLAAGPGIAPSVEERSVLNIDIAPTMMQLAGLPVPGNMDGSSLVPLLHSQPAPQWREFIYYQALQPELGSWPLHAIRTNRWKFIQTFDINDPSKVAFEEMYDLFIDPIEMENLVKHPRYDEEKRNFRALIANERNALIS